MADAAEFSDDGEHPIYRELVRIFGPQPGARFFTILPLVSEEEALAFLRAVPAGTPPEELPRLAAEFRAAHPDPVVIDEGYDEDIRSALLCATASRPHYLMRSQVNGGRWAAHAFLGAAMSNEEVYSAGLLNRALDPVTQPPEIQAFLRAELDLLQDVIATSTRVIDIGCGFGRHLLWLSDRLQLGVGVDYEHASIADARRRAGAPHLHFITCDAAAIPLVATFDFAICLTNTWGTMRDKTAVLSEMRRLAPKRGTRLLSVFSSASVRPRREWYRRLGHAVAEETSEYLASDGGFRSEHFSEARLRDLVGDCVIRPLATIAYVVTF